MNQEKIGKFIYLCRKDKKLTQEGLASKLNISDRAVSKWERGLNLPDASLMIELCNILGITVNELLSGEKIKGNDYIKNAEENMIKLKEMEEKNNKLLLFAQSIIGFTCSTVFLILLFVASFLDMVSVARAVIILVSFIVFSVGFFLVLKLERKAGYYECNKCHYRYIPTILPLWFSMHFGRTRYLKCPRCGMRSWNKKVLTK